MSKANDVIKLFEQSSGDLSAVLKEFSYGIASELDSNSDNMSNGIDAQSMFEIANDQSSNWIELQLWDKNRFDQPLGSIRYVCSMMTEGEHIILALGKGIEKIKFDSKYSAIDELADMQDEEVRGVYKKKIEAIKRVLKNIKLTVKGIVGVPNDQYSFDTQGRKFANDIVRVCRKYLQP